jgi:hypothetical protein
MSRPAPEILESLQIGDHVWTIAETEATWSVVRYERPVYLIKQHWLLDRKVYPRNTFNSEAHAQNLADKLNHMFKTTAYTIRRTT